MKQKEIRILFTGIGRRVELIQAFRQASLVLDQPIKLYGADKTGTAPALTYCNIIKIVCGMKEPGYIDELIDICKQESIDLLIPTIDTDLLVLSQNKERFRSTGTNVLVSDAEKIRICRDKFKTDQFFVQCGVKSPKPVRNWEEYKAGFPAFIKPADGSSSIGAHKVDFAEELPVYAEQLDDYIVQPYIQGTEYTVDVFCDFTGEPISIVPRKRLAVRAGEVLKTQICMDEQIIRETRGIITHFKPCGAITIQLIREEQTQEDYYLEINPRFGGGSPLSMKAGARSAESILKILRGEKPAYRNDIADGAIYSRFDNSVCIDTGKSPEQIRGVIFDLDDTLYPEKEYVRSGYKAIADYLNDPSAADKMWQFFEEGKAAIDEYLIQIHKEQEKERCLNVYRNHMPSISLRKGVIPLLNNLKDQGIKIGIITDGRPQGQKNKIAALNLNNYIDDIIITDELGGAQFRKPNDIAFRIMQARWRLPFEQIIYVGDNPAKDFQAPWQLGMKSAWLHCDDGIYPWTDDTKLFYGSAIRSLGEINNII